MKKWIHFFGIEREREREKKHIFQRFYRKIKPQFGKQARISIQPTTTTIAGKKISLESIDQKTNNHRMIKTLWKQKNPNTKWNSMKFKARKWKGYSMCIV